MKKRSAGSVFDGPGRMAFILGLVIILSSCARTRNETALSAPAGRAAAPAPLQTPQFVCFSSDDNGYSGLPGSGSEGGLHSLTELFAARRNPAGSGNPLTFDGTPLHYSFYVNTFNIDTSGSAQAGRNPGPKENPVYVKRAWREAIERGHEIGIHTHSHPHGRDFGVGEWEREIERSIEILTRPWDAAETPERPNPASGLGVARADLLGFRAPFIEPADNGMTAVQRKGLLYDSSIEEIVRPGAGADGDGFPWPYTLDKGLPEYKPPIGSHPGLWEIPIYDYIVPPDGECPRYGAAVGLRGRLKKVQDYFVPENGEITGMDWNLWNEFKLTPAEFLAVLKYSLDQHLAGNRCPMTVGLHSELYTVRPGMTSAQAAVILDRRSAVRNFLDYALSKPEVRVINHRELLDWMRRPAPDAGAGYLDDFNGPELPKDPDGIRGWAYLSGEGNAIMDFVQGDGYASIIVDATKDRRNVWWALIMHKVSEGLDLTRLRDSRHELRIEARVRASHAPRRINLHLNTQKTVDFHSHLMEFDIPEPNEWRVISMTTRNFQAEPGDMVNGQLALMDWGLGKYRLDVDYFKVDVVDPVSVGPDLGEPIPYHPPVADPKIFSHRIAVAQDGMVDSENPDVNLGKWRISEGENEISLVSVGGALSAILRWDFGAFAGKKKAGLGLLELTTYSVERTSKDIPDFGLIRVVEILGGDPGWNRESVTWKSLLREAPADLVLNPQMIIDWPVSEGDGAKTYLTIPRPVLQRLIDGRTLGIAVRPLGAIHAAFYSKEFENGKFAARLLFNLAE